MMQMHIDAVDLEKVKRILAGVRLQECNIIMSRALNATAVNVRKNIAVKIVAEYYIKNGDVKKALKIIRASTSKVRAEVRVKSEVGDLYDFKVTPRKKVSYSKTGKPNPKVLKAAVKKSSTIKALDGTYKGFITEMKNGHIGVFERKRKTAFPIRGLYSPSVPKMAENKDIMQYVQEEARKTLEKRIEHEMKFLFG